MSPMRTSTSAIDRVMARVEQDVDTGCWLFTGSLNAGGYGRIRDGEEMTVAHRVTYRAFRGPIPDGLWVLHSCDRPNCVNPAHLWLGTAADNIADREAKGRGRACREHDDWYVRPDGHRRCRVCKNRGERRRYDERKQR